MGLLTKLEGRVKKSVVGDAGSPLGYDADREDRQRKRRERGDEGDRERPDPTSPKTTPGTPQKKRIPQHKPQSRWSSGLFFGRGTPAAFAVLAGGGDVRGPW